MATTSKQQINLGLVGDGDEIDLMEECEALFGVKFSDAHIQQVRTVGDLFDLLDKEKKFTDRRTTGCYSFKGFYRLRRRLVEMGVERTLTPKTLIRDILDDLGMNFRQFRRTLKQDLGHLGPNGAVADDRMWLVRLFSALALIVWLPVVLIVDSLFAEPEWLSGPLLVGSAVLSVAVFAFCLPSLLRTEPPIYCRTVGDLARIYGAKCLDEDPGALETVAAKDAWDRFAILIRSETGYGGPVTLETEFVGDAGDWPARR
jgi:hypothetical protein